MLAIFVPCRSALHIPEDGTLLVNGASAATVVVPNRFPVCSGADFGLRFARHTIFFSAGLRPAIFLLFGVRSFLLLTGAELDFTIWPRIDLSAGQIGYRSH